MPRPKKVDAASRTLVASAKRYTGKSPALIRPTSGRQERCYHHYETFGIGRYAAKYYGHALSRTDLYIEDGRGVRFNDGRWMDALHVLTSSIGEEEFLESIGTHLVVGGECFLVGKEGDQSDDWGVYSPMEVSSGAKWQVRNRNTGNWEYLDDEATVIRIWVPSPRYHNEPDSPFLSMLPLLDEIEFLSRYIHAQTISRLTGAGILLVPEGMSFPPPEPVDGKEVVFPNEATEFMQTLGEEMLAPIEDPSSPAATVPLVVSVPGGLIEKVQHLTFWTELDENARSMRQDSIHQFALGMDLPPELVLGMSSNEGTGGGNSNGVSHWGAWMLEEQAIKLHIEPMVDAVRHALIMDYLRPLGAPGDLKIRGDTSKLKLRPDRSKESIEMYNLGRLKAEVMLRENGFSKEDMMDDEEYQDWLVRKVASGSATPEQVGGALALLGVDLPIEDQGDNARESRPDPSTQDHPTRPRDPSESSVRLYESLVLRALERAGNRLRSMHQAQTPGPSFEAHTLLSANGSTAKCLEDAWTTADLVLDEADNLDEIVKSLNGYCATLLANREPHTRDALVEWCKKAGI